MKPDRPLRYHLRFQIIPGRNVERDAKDLAAFCRRHGVEEVVLFFAAEEWNNGLLSCREENQWFDTVKRAKRVLDRAGLAVSLNPWMTVLHCDRGRRFPRDRRRFEPTESPLGEKSRACASFADPKWRAYFFRLMARFARLGFRIIWIEDDFRYHNHGPLTWGGGFEPSVLRRFSDKVGRRVTRDEVVKRILQPGKPHPWRALWMENWRETQLEVAGGLAETVATNSPVPSALGLMSSHPSVHSTEGRDWKALFDAMSIEGRVAHRPHFAGYSEGIGLQKTYSIMMLDVQKTFRPPVCEVAPEIENFPFTRWTKSDSLTWAEMALCLFNGSDALLLDLFPFSGNRASEEPGIGELLDRSRLGLEWIAARFSKSLVTQGVGMPWKQDAQAHVRTNAGRALWELDATSFGPGEFLLPYGISVSARPQAVNAVFGSMAWAFGDDEIEAMLGGGLLLDGASADILCRRGFGRHIGVKVAGLAGREDAPPYALEQVASRQCGVRPGLYLNVNLMDRLARMEPLGAALEWTTILTPERKRFGAGVVAFRNELGGRIVTFAAPNPSSLPRNYQRQAIAQRAVAFLAGSRFDAVTVFDAPHCLPTHLCDAHRHWVVVLNASPDPARPVISLPRGAGSCLEATLLAPLGKPQRVQTRSVKGKDGLRLTAQTPIPYLGFLVAECSAR